jgi:hypothetical protein
MFRGFSVLGRFAMHDVWRRHEGAFDRALRYALGYHPGDTAGQRWSTGDQGSGQNESGVQVGATRASASRVPLVIHMPGRPAGLNGD